jgi:hypothetical protein
MKLRLAILAILFILLLAYMMYSKSDCNVIESIPYKDGTIINIVNDSCTEGLPHTTNENTIIMPLASWNSMRREETLRHELVHIRQRRDSAAWFEFYRIEWNYVPIALPPELASIQIRPNPDTADKPYMIWKDRWIFLPVYTEDHTLKNAIVRVYDIRTHKFVEVPPEWTAFFSTGLHQIEHPHEISAELLTVRRNCDASNKLYEFFRKNYE